MKPKSLLPALALGLAATIAWTTLSASADPARPALAPTSASLAPQSALGETVFLTSRGGSEESRTVKVHYLVLLEGSTAKHNSQSIDVVVPEPGDSVAPAGVLLNTNSPRFLMADIPTGVSVR